MTFVLTLLAALGCGVIAGVFFAFSTFVMKALARIRPSEGIAAMQSINVAVLNPWFLGAFFGTALACLLAVASGLWRWGGRDAAYLISGGLLYLVGTFLVTVAFNVPRNNALAAVSAARPEGEALWSQYVSGWTAWNHVRTVAALAAAVCFSLALAA